MRLVQFETATHGRRVGVVSEDGNELEIVGDVTTTYDLAQAAITANRSLSAEGERRRTGERVDYDRLLADAAILPPLDHPDPAHCMVTGTGLTHLGSAQARDEMHAKLSGEDTPLTDSMKMFKIGLDGGKPVDGDIGAQPEWFWKGDGSIMIGCGRALPSPGFAEDGGEEAELAGLYVIGPDGTPFRLGFALANEFADHIMERRNYLYLAHSKLRVCAVGPELRIGPLPSHVSGAVRVRRGNEILWESEMLSGEDNMSHTIANLEHHHFKYRLFRRPGDVHVHFFGAGVLSFSSDIRTQDGDIFEIEAGDFGRPLRNPLHTDSEDRLIAVESL